MQLSQKAIKDFKEIWKKQYKEDINDQKAEEKGMRLLRLFKIIYRPIPKEDIQHVRLVDRKVKK